MILWDRIFDPAGRPERPLALGATSQSTESFLPKSTGTRTSVLTRSGFWQTYSTPCKSLSLDLVGPEDMVEEFLLPNRAFAIEQSVDPPCGWTFDGIYNLGGV